MKEHKFRGWNTRCVPPRMMEWGKDFRNVQLKNGHLTIGDSPGNEDFSLHVLTSEAWKDSMPSCQGEVILMQYTGLKDKNGKEIYEGDRLRVTEESCCLLPGMEDVVKWDDDDCGWSPFSNQNNIEEHEWIDALKNGKVEVIGNIYENPELLEKK